MRAHLATISLLAILSLACGAAAAEKLAITFDDLPLNGALEKGMTEVDLVRQTLRILERKNAVTFGFINARKLESNPNGAKALQLWVKGRQRVGNHSYSHADLNTHSIEDYGADILRNEPVLMLLSGERDWRWFRYPYLREGDSPEKRAGVRAFLRQHRYAIAQTTIDYEDYLWNTPYARCADQRNTQAIERLRATYFESASAAIAASREMSKAVFGRDINHVLLLHLGAFTPDILPRLLDLLEARGFELVTLEEAHSDVAFQSDPNYLGLRGGTLLEQHTNVKPITDASRPPLPKAELDAICR